MERFSTANRERLGKLEDELNDLREDPDLMLSHEKEPMVCDMVFAGGGAKGIAHLGALWALDRLGVRIKRLAGTSAGALTAAIVAAGYSSEEMSDALFDIDFREFRDGYWDTKLPKLALLAALSISYGMYEGDKLQAWLEEMLVRKNASTFGKLPRDEVGMLASIAPIDGQRLTVMASDITHATEVCLPRDLEDVRYGRHRTRSFPISAAVRMSVSVPFFFTPYKLHNSLIVDGAFATNLPLEVFDKEDVTKVRWPTLGINLGSAPSPSHEIENLYHFGLAIFDTMKYGQSRMSYLNYPTRMCRLIDVDAGQVRTLDFDISKEKKEMLFINGAKEVLATLRGDQNKGIRKVWNFHDYLRLRERWSFPGKEGPYA